MAEDIADGAGRSLQRLLGMGLREAVHVRRAKRRAERGHRDEGRRGSPQGRRTSGAASGTTWHSGSASRSAASTDAGITSRNGNMNRVTVDTRRGARPEPSPVQPDDTRRNAAGVARAAARAQAAKVADSGEALSPSELANAVAAWKTSPKDNQGNCSTHEGEWQRARFSMLDVTATPLDGNLNWLRSDLDALGVNYTVERRAGSHAAWAFFIDQAHAVRVSAYLATLVAENVARHGADRFPNLNRFRQEAQGRPPAPREQAAAQPVTVVMTPSGAVDATDAQLLSQLLAKMGVPSDLADDAELPALGLSVSPDDVHLSPDGATATVALPLSPEAERRLSPAERKALEELLPRFGIERSTDGTLLLTVPRPEPADAPTAPQVEILPANAPALGAEQARDLRERLVAAGLPRESVTLTFLDDACTAHAVALLAPAPARHAQALDLPLPPTADPDAIINILGEAGITAAPSADGRTLTVPLATTNLTRQRTQHVSLVISPAQYGSDERAAQSLVSHLARHGYSCACTASGHIVVEAGPAGAAGVEGDIRTALAQLGSRSPAADALRDAPSPQPRPDAPAHTQAPARAQASAHIPERTRTRGSR